MKFIHTADIHLDSRASAIKSFHGQKPLSISHEVKEAFSKLLDVAILEKVDFIVIAGDLFDKDWEDYSLGLFFIQEIKRVCCPIYYIKGNHDATNRLTKKLPFPPHLHIFDHTQSQTILNEDLKVAIHGQSYAHYHIEDDLAKEYPQALPGYLNIGLLHTSGDRKNGEDPYAPYHLESIKKKEYDYWALGHLHTPQILLKTPWMVYSGVLQGRYTGESGVKGYYLVECENQQVETVTFKPQNGPQWEILEIEVSGIKDEKSFKELFLKSLEKKIAASTFSDQRYIFRYVFTGQFHLKETIFLHKEHWRNTLYCWQEEAFEQEIYIEKIIDCTEVVESNSKDLGPIWNLVEDSLGKELERDLLHNELKELKSQLYEKTLPDDIWKELNYSFRKKEANVKILAYLRQKFEEVIS